MYSLKLILNIQKDARNRWNACNKISHGVNRREKIDKEIADKLIDKTQEEAYVFLLPYLEDLYKKDELNNILQIGQEKIDKDIDAACQRMEKITNTKLYRNDFTGYITTFPRMPYNYKEGFLYLCCMGMGSIKNYMGNFLHELLHFQFIHHFSNHPSILALNTDQFEFLKEALTFILNYEFKEFLGKEDQGYIIHQELRKKLTLYWETNKNFEELVIYGANTLKENG